MLSEKSRNNVNYIRIVNFLKDLLADGLITVEEYKRAKGYYKKLTGADISVLD